MTADELDAAIRGDVRAEAAMRADQYAEQAAIRHDARLSAMQHRFWLRLVGVIDGIYLPTPGDLTVIAILAADVRARLKAEAHYEAQRARIYAAEGSTA